MRYNQYHDQLVLSSSSDGHVVLASMASISSEPHGHLIEEEDDLDGSDGDGAAEFSFTFIYVIFLVKNCTREFFREIA